jgi:hypothetical protein
VVKCGGRNEGGGEVKEGKNLKSEGTRTWKGNAKQEQDKKKSAGPGPDMPNMDKSGR